MKHDVSIIIPTWNGKDLLAKYLPSVIVAAEKLGDTFKELIVVDDASTDDSDQFLRRTFPQVTIVSHSKNRGFINAINSGIGHASGSLVLLLNSDIEPHPDAFMPLIRHFDDPLLFGVSGRIYGDDKKTFLYGNRGASFRFGHFYLREKDEYATSQNLFVCGGAGIFSRDKFLALGGFDTLYSPMYYEEQDISYRALKRGWHIAYEPTSVMYHEIRGTIGKLARSKKLSYLSARNNYLFVIKNITDIRYTLQALFCIPLFLLRDVCQLKFRFWIAFACALPRIPHALYNRLKEQPHRRCSDRDILSRVASS